jgi:ribosomal protein S17E
MSILAQFGITKESAIKPVTKSGGAGGSGVSLNEKLARTYDDIAIKVNELVGKDDTKKDRESVTGYITITNKYVKATPRVGGKAKAKLLDGVDGIEGSNYYRDADMDKNKRDAAKLYNDLAEAIRAEQADLIELVDAARKRNKK